MDWVAVGGQVLQAVLAVFGTALAGLLVLAAKKLCDRWHLALGAEQQAALESAAAQAVHAAEEWDKQQTAKPSGNEKMDFAMSVVRDVLGSKTYQTYAEPRVKAMINAALNLKRQTGEIADPPKPDAAPTIPADLGVKL